MQETITTTPDDGLPPPRPRRFRLIALGLVLVLFVPFAYAAYRNIADAVSDPNPGPNPAFPEPNFSLTDQEAIARFQELDEIRVKAYKTADLGLVSQFAAPGPFKEQVVGELRQLKQDQVTASIDLDTKQIQVTSNSAVEINLEQVVVTDIRFFDDSNNEVTDQGSAQRWVINWTMQSLNSKWLIASSDIIRTQPIK